MKVVKDEIGSKATKQANIFNSPKIFR